jgi:two-component system sensor histidine kinase VanS
MLNNRISRKIFYSTSGILLFIVALFVIVLFYIMPKIYTYNINQENRETIDYINTQMPTDTVVNAKKFIASSPQLDDHIVAIWPLGDPSEFSIKYSHQSELDNEPGQTIKLDQIPLNREDIYGVKTKVVIEGQEYMIAFDSQRYPIQQIYSSFTAFLPILIIFMALISVALGFAITRRLSKPLLLLNRKVHELSEFNFDSTISIDEDTELGDISKALDFLSINLKNGMQSLEEAKQRAIDNEKTRRDFLAIMSHELKTPLTIIRGQNECMLENRGVYKDRDKYLQQNLEIIDEMEALVKRILLSLKIDDENLQTVDVECDVTSLVIRNVTHYENLMSEKNLITNYNLTPVTIFNDKAMLSYAIKNMIENAFFYADPETDLSIELNEEYISVKNIAVNMNADSIEELFKPFKTNDSSRNKKISGSGLGLYIIRRSIEVMQLEYSMTKDKDTNVVEFKLFLNKKDDIN